MLHLVLGGTGTVGSHVVEGLVEANQDVRVLTRSPEHLEALPDEAAGVIGNMEDPSTYSQIFSGVDKLFLLNPDSKSELHQGLAALNEARRHDVQHVVYLSVHDVEKGRHIPHFATKIAVEKALRSSDRAVTILRANNFFQNDLPLRTPIIEHGVYPQPIGSVGLSRVDARDIAEATVNAFTEPGHENETYPLVGPEPLTGQDCAAVYSDALDTTVQYGGNDLERWSAQARETLPDWLVYNLKMMHSMYQEEGLIATKEQLKRTHTILGRNPRRYRDFVNEVVADWREEESTPVYD